MIVYRSTAAASCAVVVDSATVDSAASASCSVAVGSMAVVSYSADANFAAVD